MSTTKRRLVQYNLKRNKENVNLAGVKQLIRKELDGPGSISGYRGMGHTLCVKYGVYVPRQQVTSILKIINPHGIEERKQHKLKEIEYTSLGHNYCWHADGYDKLKPYGFPIYGAIDGYSGSRLIGQTMIHKWPQVFF